jgi:hypothetical protein
MEPGTTASLAERQHHLPTGGKARRTVQGRQMAARTELPKDSQAAPAALSHPGRSGPANEGGYPQKRCLRGFPTLPPSTSSVDNPNEFSIGGVPASGRYLFVKLVFPLTPSARLISTVGLLGLLARLLQ